MIVLTPFSQFQLEAFKEFLHKGIIVVQQGTESENDLIEVFKQLGVE